MNRDHLVEIRSANGFGTVIYKDNNQKLAFWFGNGVAGSWNTAVTAPSVTTAGTYNVVATWNGTSMVIDVTGSATGNASVVPGTVGFNQGTQLISFGNGENARGEFFFDGRLSLDWPVSLYCFAASATKQGIRAKKAGVERERSSTRELL